MPAPTPEDCEVLVVGAGPTGLMLALTLRSFGVAVRLIDKAPHPSVTSKALAVWSGSLEALAPLGAVESFLAEGMRLRAVVFGSGRRRIGRMAIGEGVDSPYPFAVLIPQSRTEALLAARLDALGLAPERGTTLLGLQQDAAGVTADLMRADGSRQACRCRYLVGCDGARSSVRNALNIAFEGQTEPTAFVLGDVRIQGALEREAIHIWWRGGGTAGLFPISGEVWRLMAGRPPGGGDAPPTLAELQAIADAHGPPGLTLSEPSWLSTFQINERLAAAYRQGRCFLAGDAAHVHSPAGGQGMNTGLQDAANLAWKLALALQERGAVEGLLDSYAAERRPVAREVVEQAATRLRLAFYVQDPLRRRLRTLGVSTLLQIGAVRRRMQRELSETEVRYDPAASSALQADARGARPAVGQRLRDVTLRDREAAAWRPLWPLLAPPRHLLLLFGAAQPAVAAAMTGLEEVLDSLAIDATLDPDGSATARYGARGGGWLLVRPDQVIGARGGHDEADPLRAYVERVLRRR